MKHRGAFPDFTTARNLELMAAYRHVIASTSSPISRIEICRRVALYPCSRFWVSEERAAIVVAAIIKGDSLSSMSANKREMFFEIFRRYKAMKAEYPHIALTPLVARIVWQPAPKFYLTPLSVGEIVYRIKNGYYVRR